MADSDTKSPKVPPLPEQAIVPNAGQPQQKRPLSPEQAFGLALKLHGEGKLPETEKILRQILKTNPRHAPSLHLMGVLAHQSNQTELAIKLIAEAISFQPTEALYHSNRGEMCRILGRLDGAIEHGEQAVTLDPNSASAHSNLGIAYYDSEDYERAEACQKKALAIDPNCIAALNNMGSIQREHDNKEAAMDFYRKALAVQPNHLEAINNLGAVLTEEERFDESVEVLIKAVKLKPDYAEAHCNIAQAFVGLEDYKKALTGYTRAISLKDDYPEAHMGLCRVQQEQNQLPAAEKSILRALELAPEKPEAHALLGALYTEMGYPDRAEQAFKEALTLDNEQPRAINGMGTLKMQMGDLEEAEACFHKALALKPDDLVARISLTQARKTKVDDENLKQLEAEIPKFDDMPNSRAMSLHFALGKCYDDLKEPAKAFPHFLKGCEIKRSKIDYDAEAQDRHVQDIINFFSAEKLQQLSGNGDPSDLPVFILGMPRSGTTLTEQIISSHPLIHGAGELPDLLELANHPGEQSTTGYPQSLEGLSHNDITALGSKYITGLRERSADASRITDKMPANFFCVGLIHLMLPNAKIVHIRRNPVDTCLSGFSRLFNHGQMHSYDLTEIGRYYRNYDRLMKHWHQVLPTGSFKEIQYEDLVADKENQSRALIDFCGLEWDDACLDFHKNKRSIRTASVTQVRRPIYNSSVARWKQYEEHLGPLLATLGDLVPTD